MQVQGYKKRSELKNALVNLVISQMSRTAPKIRELTDLYRSFDRDGDGIVTCEELATGKLTGGSRAVIVWYTIKRLFVWWLFGKSKGSNMELL